MVDPTLSYQSIPIPVSSDMLSVVVCEVELGAQESPHFLRESRMILILDPVALQSSGSGSHRAAVHGLLAGRGFHLPVRQKLGVNEDHVEKLLEAAHQVREPTCLVGRIILILFLKK